MPISVKHVSEKPSVRDGQRVLVERTWPRTLSREDGDVDAWLRELGPSSELRQWLIARPTQWPVFRRRYLGELTTPAAHAALRELYDIARAHENVTLVFAGRNREHNAAVILKELLEGMRKPPSSSGPLKAPAVAMRARRPRR